MIWHRQAAPETQNLPWHRTHQDLLRSQSQNTAVYERLNLHVKIEQQESQEI